MNKRIKKKLARKNCIMGLYTRPELKIWSKDTPYWKRCKHRDLVIRAYDGCL